MRRNTLGLIAGLAAFAATVGGAAAQTAGSGQLMSNSVVGGTATPGLGVGDVNPGQPLAAVDGVGGAQGSATSDSVGFALSNEVLGGSNAGNGIPAGADPADWGLADGVGKPLIISGDLALKSRGYQGGLEGQGIDTSKITGSLEFKNVMPAGGQVAGALGMATGLLGIN